MLDRPVTSCVISACLAVWLRIHSAGLGYQDVGCSFDLVMRQRQLWRLLSAQVSAQTILSLLMLLSLTLDVHRATALRPCLLLSWLLRLRLHIVLKHFVPFLQSSTVTLQTTSANLMRI